jgi:hypothetical protein
MTMPEIIRSYLRTFDVHRRAKFLESLGRFRALPAWVPSRSLLYRSASPEFTHWR